MIPGNFRKPREFLLAEMEKCPGRDGVPIYEVRLANETLIYERKKNPETLEVSIGRARREG